MHNSRVFISGSKYLLQASSHCIFFPVIISLSVFDPYCFSYFCLRIFPQFFQGFDSTRKFCENRCSLKHYFILLWIFTTCQAIQFIFADSVQMTAKNILCGLGNDKFGFEIFEYFRLKYMLKISSVNICDRQVIFNNIRQFLSVENYYSLISNQPLL